MKKLNFESGLSLSAGLSLIFILTLSLILSLLAVPRSKAAVWSASRTWDQQWQDRYSAWIANEVGPEFFKKLGGPYARLRMDCADAQYALRAYFSYINGLDFSIRKGGVTERTNRFDHISNQDQRLASFIDFLSGSFGTESLAHNDTYPVAVAAVRPGDVFMYKVGSNGNYTRHTYIIKNINLDGTFDVIYTTQARRDKGLPLRRRPTYMFTKAPTNTGVDANHWGFRRSKIAAHSAIAQENLNYSDFSQYVMARKYGRLEFFRQVKKIHQRVSESANMTLKRNFSTVCSAVQERVGVVQSGLDYVRSQSGQCVNERNYDAYSTPSRDSGIMDKYRNFTADFNEVARGSSAGQVDAGLMQNSRLILSDGNLNQSSRNAVYRSCPVSTGIGGVDIASFRRALFAKQVSYHPNDNEHWRWGYPNGSRTRCPEYYGYPN